MKIRVAVGACVLLTALAGAVPAGSAPRPKQPDRTAPTVPTDLRITAATEDSISVAWTASTDNSGAIHHYVTCYSGWMIPAPGPCIWGPPVPPAKTVTGLVPGKEFTFQVKAVDAAGNESALSSPVTGSTAPDVTPPTAPTNARVTATTPSSVSLAWDRSTDGWGFGYQVLMDGEVVGTTWDLAFRVRHLTPGTTHTFAVRARDSSGNLSAAANAGTVALEASRDRTPPSTPTNLTALQPPDDFCGSNVLPWVTVVLAASAAGEPWRVAISTRDGAARELGGWDPATAGPVWGHALPVSLRQVAGVHLTSADGRVLRAQLRDR